MGLANREQQRVIAHLRTENQVLKEKFGKKRILLNDDQRRRLAVKGKQLRRKMLGQIATIVSPDSILRWYRKLIAAKWSYSQRRKRCCSCPRTSVGRHPVQEKMLRPIVAEVESARQREMWGVMVGFDWSRTVLERIQRQIASSTTS